MSMPIVATIGVQLLDMAVLLRNPVQRPRAGQCREHGRTSPLAVFGETPLRNNGCGPRGSFQRGCLLRLRLRISQLALKPNETSSTTEFRRSMEQIARCNQIDVGKPSVRVCSQIETTKQF